MSSSATSCFKCQINLSCEVALEFHQLIFHFESDDELESHVYLDPPLTETSHQDVGEQVPSSEQNPCEEPQNEIEDFDWTIFNEVPSIEADWELESYIGLDLLLSEPQDVQKNLGEQVLATKPYFCEESQNEIDDFDWTTFNEVPSIEADCGLESHVYPDPQLTKHQNVQDDGSKQILTTEPYPCKESQNEIDDFDWSTFNEVPSIEADWDLQSHMDLDLQLTKYQDVQEDVDEQILTIEPNPCQESQIKSDDFHQTSFIQVSKTEVSCDQEQNEHHKTVQKKFCKERKDHKCNVCQKTFTHQSHLKTHVKTVHDKQRELECGVCQKTFSSKTYVKIHKKLIHDKQKDYECDVCQKSFTQKSSLKMHMKTVHDKQKDFECNVCQKTFTQQNNLRRHQKAVHEGRKDYECDVCQKRFSRKSIVTKHKKIVHDKRKDYECDEGHKVFSEEGNLKQHKNAVHEGQKNFECGACQKTFTLQKFLKEHIKIVHDKQTKGLRVPRMPQNIYTARPFKYSRTDSS